MEPYVVEGTGAKITKFPHSAFLAILCHYEEIGETQPWTCGSSILNSRVVLTAAHCLWGCAQSTKALVMVGSSSIAKGIDHAFAVMSFVLHEKYVDHRHAYDLALATTERPFVLGPTVKRVALMENPPYYEPAEIAGWGYINVSFLQVFTIFLLFCFMLARQNHTVVKAYG